MPDLNAINESGVGYVVVIRRSKDNQLATACYRLTGITAVFSTRGAALDFRDDLKACGYARSGKAVKVTYRIGDFVKGGNEHA